MDIAAQFRFRYEDNAAQHKTEIPPRQGGKGGLHGAGTPAHSALRTARARMRQSGMGRAVAM